MNPETIENLANLARIPLAPEERDLLLTDLNKILKYVEEINSVEASEEEKEYLLKNQMREDQNPDNPGDFSADLLASAAKVQDNFIKVKKVL